MATNITILPSLGTYHLGMLMPGRSYSSNSYRFGFNGKENDNEIKGTGNSQDYGMRIYDPRIVRFNSVDPLTKQFPFYSPYQFSDNSFIMAIDLDGAEPKSMITEQGKLTQPMISLLNGAFDYDINSLQATTWYPVKRGFHGDAMTVDNTVKFKRSILATYGNYMWMNLIAHEQEHRNEMGNDPINQAEWYLGYTAGWATAGFDYDNNPYELRAFAYGDPMSNNNSDYGPLMNQLLHSKGNKIMDILNSDKSENYKSLSLKLIGLEFRKGQLEKHLANEERKYSKADDKTKAEKIDPIKNDLEKVNGNISTTKKEISETN